MASADLRTGSANSLGSRGDPLLSPSHSEGEERAQESTLRKVGRVVLRIFLGLLGAAFGGLIGFVAGAMVLGGLGAIIGGIAGIALGGMAGVSLSGHLAREGLYAAGEICVMGCLMPFTG